MKFKKGVSGNPAGRPPGAIGEKTAEHLTRARKLLVTMEKHMQFEKFVDNLTPREFSMLYRDLLEFVEPKMSRQEIIDPNRKAVQITVRVQGDPVLDRPFDNSLPEPITECEEIKQTNLEDEF